MLRAGLTGGIASGKSTVAEMLQARGCPVLQLDPLGHKLIEPGEAAYGEVVKEFGREILQLDGGVDRAKLGAIVFADGKKRARLNQILHPPILAYTNSWFDSLEAAGKTEVAFVEAALLIEASYREYLSTMIVCWCRPEQQLERLQQRGLSAGQAKQRIAAQMPVDEKRKLADETIDCSLTLEETAHQVDALLAKLKLQAAVKPVKN
jgi:dephospho-CoA kinase